MRKLKDKSCYHFNLSCYFKNYIYTQLQKKVNTFLVCSQNVEQEETWSGYVPSSTRVFLIREMTLITGGGGDCKIRGGITKCGVPFMGGSQNCGYLLWGDHKISIRQNGGIAKFQAR